MGSPKGRGVNLLLLALGLGLVFLGTLIHKEFELAGKMPELIGLAVEHLGIGVFAVTVLKITLEKAAQTEFLNRLSNAVMSRVTNIVNALVTKSSWILSNEELKRELERSVLTPDFIRPFYHLELKLEPLQSQTDLLQVWVTITFQVKNISLEDKPYVVEVWLDDVIKLDPSVAPKPGFTIIKIGPNSLAIDPLIEKANNGGEDGAIYREGHMIYLKDLITPPIKSLGILDITVKGMQIMRREDHFVWNLPRVTEKLTFSVELANGLTFNDLEVCPREMHHISHEEFMRTLDPSIPNVWKLEIDHVILPFQGVELRWAPKPAAQAITGTDSLKVNQQGPAS